MTARPGDVDRRALDELAAVLRPDLAAEVARLYDVETAYDDLVARARALEQDLRSSTVMVGDLRQRALRAERRLADLDVDEISTARRGALFAGVSWLRVTSLGGGRYTTRHVPAREVTHRERD